MAMINQQPDGGPTPAFHQSAVRVSGTRQPDTYLVPCDQVCAYLTLAWYQTHQAHHTIDLSKLPYLEAYVSVTRY
jgi:hypothetical protein